jgi:hypothetical protein
MGKKNKSPEMPAPEVVIEQAEMPTRPPVQEERGRPEGMPTTPPVEGVANAAANSVEEQAKKDEKVTKFIRNAIIVGVLAAGAVIAVRGCSDDKDSTPTGNTTTTVVENPTGRQSESCPEGIFTKENPYAAAAQVKPGSLMRNPESALKNKEQAYAYLMGDKNEEIQGELCALPSSLAAFETVFNGWVGDGATQSRPFGSFTQDANELNKFYASNPEDAEKKLNNSVFKAFVGSFELNKEAIEGGVWFQIALLGDQIVQQELQLGNIEAGSVFKLEGNVWNSDSKYTGNQVFLMDRKTGNIFVLNSIGGVPKLAPTPESTTTSTTAPANSDSWSATPGNNSGNGNSNTAGPGPNGPGSNGPGSNGPGSNGPGPNGPGSNGPGSNGPGSNGPGPNGPRPTPTTTTPRPTPTTTTPRPTPTTTPTTQPKGPEVTIPGAPN